MITTTRLGISKGIPLISIIIPTIKGRERWLKKCLASYLDSSPECEVIIVRDRPTCGIAWNDGYRQATGEYLHFSADDLEAHEGWWQGAIIAAENNLIPAPRILNPDGTLQGCADMLEEYEQGSVVSFTRIPFLSRKQARLIAPIITTHYSTDLWVSEVGRMHGYQTVMVNEYLFTHHLAQEGRLDERVVDDAIEVLRQLRTRRRATPKRSPYPSSWALV